MIGSILRYLPNPVSQFLTASYFKYSAWRANSYYLFHSDVKLLSFEDMKIRILPALQDNYMYLIVDEATNEAAVVDPVEPESVMRAVRDEGVNLKSVLTTHHHWDHAGGNDKLADRVEDLEIYGGDSRVTALTHKVRHGEKIKLGSLTIKCLFTPCHTKGHICYYIEPRGRAPIVFTGDTLFIGGCGRFFEGTADQMYKALIEVLGALPDNTEVYCGHEYTLANLKFAEHVEPHNQDIKNKIILAHKQRSQRKATVPSTIGEEKLTNPFMRVNERDVQRFAKCNDGISTMAYIRNEKDHF